LHDATIDPVDQAVVPRSSESQHRLTTGVSFDVIDLDGEAAIAPLKKQGWKGTAADAVVKTGTLQAALQVR
jgi:hypothetical protein